MRKRFLAVLAASMLASVMPSFAASCVISADFSFTPPVEGVVTPMRIVAKKIASPTAAGQSGPSQSGAASAAPRRPACEEQGLSCAAIAAIQRNDIAEFNRLLPGIPDRYLVVAMNYARNRAAVPIVRRILDLRQQRLAQGKPDFKVLTPTDVFGLAFAWQRIADFDHASNAWKGKPTAADFLEVLRLYLAAGADPDSGTTKPAALNYLTRIPPSAESVEAVRLLLAKGASVDAAPDNTDGASPLVTAAGKGNLPVLDLLLQQRTFDQRVKDTALARAVEERHYTVGVRLADAGGKGTDVSRSIRLADLAHDRSPAAMELMKSLIKRGIDINATNGATDTALMVKVRQFDTDAVLMLLKAGASPNVQNYQGDTALHFAARVPQGLHQDVNDTRPPEVAFPGLNPALRRDMVRLLLQQGSDPNIANKEGYTPVMYTTGQDAESIDAMLAKGATVRVVGNYGVVNMKPLDIGPVSWALINRKPTLAAGLLSHGKRIAPADCGAVYYAAASGDARTLSLLLDLGADSSVSDATRNYSPMTAAAAAGRTEAVKLLADRQPNLADKPTPAGVGSAGGHGIPVLVPFGLVTPLMAAAGNGHEPVVKLLLERGARKNARDAQGRSAHDYALHGNHEAVARLLKP